MKRRMMPTIYGRFAAVAATLLITAAFLAAPVRNSVPTVHAQQTVHGNNDKASPSDSLTFGELISSINHTRDTIALFDAIPPGPPNSPPALINAQSVIEGGNAHALNEAIERHRADILALQQALVAAHPPGPCTGDVCIQTWPGMMSYLTSHGVGLGQVIAAIPPGPPAAPQTLTIVYWSPTS
jgi:hypothetical protein